MILRITKIKANLRNFDLKTKSKRHYLILSDRFNLSRIYFKVFFRISRYSNSMSSLYAWCLSDRDVKRTGAKTQVKQDQSVNSWFNYFNLCLFCHLPIITSTYYPWYVYRHRVSSTYYPWYVYRRRVSSTYLMIWQPLDLFSNNWLALSYLVIILSVLQHSQII